MRRFRCTRLWRGCGPASRCLRQHDRGQRVARSTYEGPPFKKVMVIAWVDRPSVRRTVEDIFVGDLTSRGIGAVASYTLIPDPPM